MEAVRARFAPPAVNERRLRVLVDPGYGRLLVTPLIPRFLESYGDFELQVVVIDTLPPVPGTDWDLLVCNDSSPLLAVAPASESLPLLTRTPLGNPPLLLCATPAYLARHGQPRNPAQLSDQQWCCACSRRAATPSRRPPRCTCAAMRLAASVTPRSSRYACGRRCRSTIRRWCTPARRPA